MTRNNLKTFPFFIILFPVFFIWHILNAYFALIPFRYWSPFLLYYTGVSALLFFSGKWVFKNTGKAGCWAMLLLVLFFFWGAMLDFIKTFALPPFFTSYKFLLPLVLILLAWVAFLLKKSNSSFPGLNAFFNLLLIVCVFFEVILSIYKLIDKTALKNDYAYYNKALEPVTAKIADNLKPDIFFIIFDEYTSTIALKKYFGYDNSRLDSTLLNNNFFIAKGSKSNYNSTPLSIGSSLNLQYFNADFKKESTVPRMLLRGQYSMKKSLLPAILSDQGYSIVNAGVCEVGNYPAPVEPNFNKGIKAILYKETLWGRVRKEILWNFGKLLFGTDYKITTGLEENIITNKNNFQRILQELNTQTTQPKFVFGHILSPHPPSFYDSSGRQRAMTRLDETTYSDSLYVDQLIYINNWIDTVVKSANKQWGRPRLVIIEGDHGKRGSSPSRKPAASEKEFMNLNAYYFSDKNYSLLYDSISPVNSFRVVLNKYFNTNLAMLGDSTIFLR
jgi:Sulfatase